MQKYEGASLFNSETKITQFFGENPQFYSKFGLLGHEGIDVVPTGDDWTVLSPVSGYVKHCYVSKTYGKTVLLKDFIGRFMIRFAHLSEIYVNEGIYYKKGRAIGKMGNTPGTIGIDGQPMRAHLHINVVPVDKNDNRVYLDNGFKGRIDPLGYLEALKHGYKN